MCIFCDAIIQRTTLKHSEVWEYMQVWEYMKVWVHASMQVHASMGTRSKDSASNTEMDLSYSIPARKY